MAQLILVTGGARSGKSDYALQRAEEMDGRHCFIATCPVIDSEMDERIARHREERSAELWDTVEEEIEVATTLQSLTTGTVCLLDCLTLWINNLMYCAEQKGEQFQDAQLQIRVRALLEAADQFQGTLICVSNEVGMGVVPDNPAARLYRDLVGRCNRIIAAAADEAILVSCGLPLFLKQQ